MKPTSLILFSAILLGGCATVTQHQQQPTPAPVLPTRSPVPAETTNPPEAKSLSICTAVQGQAEAYMQNAITSDKEEAKDCLGRGSDCWVRFAGLLDAQKSGMVSLFGASACPNAQAFGHFAESYLRATARVARDCGMGVGVPKCFATPSASAAKTRKAELEQFLEGQHG